MNQRFLAGLVVLVLILQSWQRLPTAGAAPAPAPSLTFSPLGASVGAPVVALGTGLPLHTPVRLVWYRGTPHWRVHAGLFSGIAPGETPVPLGQGSSDGRGRVRIPFTVPADFGYLHTVTLVAHGTTLARQGFTVIPTLSISPSAGPLGTLITITLRGDGYRLWESVWHLLYDTAQTGWLSAITTHGTATAIIPATGAPGTHILQVIEGTHPAPYLNEQQSPIYQPLIPTVLKATFRLTPGRPVLPPAPALQELPRAAASAVLAGTSPQIRVNHQSGTVGSLLTVTGKGFAPSAPVHLTWSTTVGNRLSGHGFQRVTRSLATVRTGAQGTFSLTLATPDDVGGQHTLSASTASGPSVGAVYTITPRMVGLTPPVVRPGDPITLHLTGVGYTQTANIYTVVMDNDYIGYACGANSQGNVTIHLFAPGGVGLHYVDLYPAIYEGTLFGQEAFQQLNAANVSYFQIPMLNVADHPGEHLPSFQLIFRVRR